MKKEKKSKRVEFLIKPSLYKKFKGIAIKKGVSISKFLNGLVIFAIAKDKIENKFIKNRVKKEEGVE